MPNICTHFRVSVANLWDFESMLPFLVIGGRVVVVSLNGTALAMVKATTSALKSGD